MVRSPFSLTLRAGLVTVGAILIGFILLVIVALATDLGREIVAKQVSRALSSPASQISIGRIEGQLASDFTIRDIAFTDPQGAWLNIDAVRIRWKPLALLRIQLAIDTLDADRVEVHRKPVSDLQAESPSNAKPLSLPRLPISMELTHVSVANLITDAPVLGIPASLSVAGTAHLTSQSLGFRLDAERLDEQGKLATELDFATDDQALRLSLHLDEPAGGILAELAGFPDRPPVHLAVDGDGTLNAFRAKLAFHAGSTIDSDGTLTLETAGTDHNLALDLMAHLPSFSFDHLGAKAKIAPSRVADNVFDLETEAETTGLRFRDPALSEAIGPEIHLNMQGAGQPTGPVQVKRLMVNAPALSANFTGEAGTERLKGRMEAEVPNVSKFAKLTGLSLQGQAKLAADLEGVPSARNLTATIDATAHRLATGVTQIDGLTGGEARLTGGVRSDPETGIRFDTLNLVTAHANAYLDGAANLNTAHITARLTIPSLEKSDKRLSGRGEVVAHVTGTLDHPDATLSAEIRDGTLLGRPVPRLGLEAQGTDLLGTFDAKATLDGGIGGKPAQGTVHFARLANNDFQLSPFHFKIGSVTANGTITVGADWLASGKLTLHGSDLDDLSPLALEKLTGAIDADLTFSREDSRQDITLTAKGQKLAGFGMGLDKLSADLTATDLFQRPSVTGFAEAVEVRVGGQTITRLRLDAKGASGATNIKLTALAQGVDVEASGRLDSSTPLRVDISELDAHRGGTRVVLAAPATITRENEQTIIRNLTLLMNGGRLSIDGRVGPNSDLRVKAIGVPLSVATLVDPDLGLSGTLDGEAAMAGPLGSPTGTYRLRIANVVTTQSRNAGLPPAGAEASGSLEGTRARLDSKIAAGAALHATVTGIVPFAFDGPLDLVAKGTIDAAIANGVMAAQGRRVTGIVAVDSHVTGLLAKPNATGTIMLSNGSFRDDDLGTRFDTIHAKLVAQGDKITIENASAVSRNGGVLTLSGDVRLDPASGFPGSIKIVGQRAEIVRNAMATAIVDLDLTLTGPLSQDPHVGGKVDIETLDISIADQLPSSARPLEGTKHIRPTPTAQRRLALAAKSKASRGGTPFNATLDVLVDVPGHIRVTGRGLDAELGGSLKVLGSLTEPKPEGTFHLIQGKMQILATQLDFTRANLTFAGDLSPQLDFLATTQAGGASIRIAVTGKPNDPQFEFSSSPDYPEDEILSRLLFGQPAGNLTPTQALTLTQVVAIYSGGSSALEGLRRSLGLGDSSASSDPLSNWFGNRVSLGIRTGATPGQTGLGVDISIWRQLRARGTIDSKGDASVGVGAETEW